MNIATMQIQEYIEVDISNSKYGTTHWAGESGDMGFNVYPAIYT